LLITAIRFCHEWQPYRPAGGWSARHRVEPRRECGRECAAALSAPSAGQLILV